MIRLRRVQLFELSYLFEAANTPISFVKRLIETEAFRSLNKPELYTELNDYYNFLTARARRSYLSMGLAYVVLAVLITIKPSKLENSVDPACLAWGEQIRDYLVSKSTNPKLYNFDLKNIPIISVPASGKATSILLGPDGNLIKGD